MWHTESITDQMQLTWRELVRAEALASFYLAGGTGLALQLGHRRSHDFDFFSSHVFDERALAQRLEPLPEFSLTSMERHTLHVLAGETKLSFLAYDYPLLFPLQNFVGGEVADPRDIACMKLSAVASRGAKRDFVDLYVAGREFGLSTILDLFRQKYTRASYNGVHLLKSLDYFEDAESDPMPDMLTPLKWEDVKTYFRTEVPRLL